MLIALMVVAALQMRGEAYILPGAHILILRSGHRATRDRFPPPAPILTRSATHPTNFCNFDLRVMLVRNHPRDCYGR